MVLLNWYSYSLAPLMGWLAKAFEHSFRWLRKLGWAPDIFFIIVVFLLFLTWMYMLSRYAKEGKDKGLID